MDSQNPMMSPTSTITEHQDTGGSGCSNAFFSWSAYSSPSPASSTEDDQQNLRSVSQIGEPPDSASEISAAASGGGGGGGSSHPYVRMVGNRSVLFSSAGGSTRLPDRAAAEDTGDYMSILYNAIIQRQQDGLKDPPAASSSSSSSYLKMIRQAGTLVEGASRLRASGTNGGSVGEIYSATTMTSMANSRKHSSGNLQRSNSVAGGAASAARETSARRRRPVRVEAEDEARAEFLELMQEVERKREYRIGLNLFNTKPEVGVDYLVRKGFLELSPVSVAKFLFHRSSGMAQEKVGEYLCNLQSPFAGKALSCFVQEMSFSGLRVDKALRLLLARVRIPGEAQKVERVMEEFGRRYLKCNPGFSAKLKCQDSIVTLAFAVMLLNTDLHTPNLKAAKKMDSGDFCRNLAGVDGGRDFDQRLLRSIYRSVKRQEFVGGPDHVAQTQAIQRSLVLSAQGSGKLPLANLVRPHRRLVCLCRLYEVADSEKLQCSSPGLGTRKPSGPGPDPPRAPPVDLYRDLFLFNDVLVVTRPILKSNSSKGGKKLYSYRDSFELRGLEVKLFQAQGHQFGIRISRKATRTVLMVLHAASEHDQYKFAMDLQESICEMDQMEEWINNDN